MLLAVVVGGALVPVAAQSVDLDQQPRNGPIVESVDPPSGEWFDEVRVVGSRFGDTVGTVLFGDVESRLVTAWTDSSITVRVPSGTEAGRVSVRVRLPRVSEQGPAVESAGSASVLVANHLSPRPEGRYEPGLVRFRLERGADHKAVAARHAVANPRPVDGGAPSAERFYEADVVAGQERQRIHALAKDVEVEWAEPVSLGRVAADATPNDPDRVSQYELSMYNMGKAWNYATGTSGVSVAVVDSGVNAGHEDLAGKVVSQRDYTGQGLADACNHGTAVASVAGAATNNGRGMSAVGWNTPIRSYKVLNSACGGFESHAANAINQAVADGARVINLSVGYPGACSSLMQSAVNNANSNGRTVVVAAGNNGSPTPASPANCTGTINVGWVDKADMQSPSSNYGPWVTVMAVGTTVYAALSGQSATSPDCGVGATTYGQCNGTSFAAPAVAGEAALLAGLGATRDQIRTYITRHTVPVSCPRGGCGSGRVEIGQAVQAFKLGQAVGVAATATGTGYWIADTRGAVGALGDGEYRGNVSHLALAQPVSAIDGRGSNAYWMFARDGGVFAFGVGHYGSMAGHPLSCAVVGGRGTPSGAGYWEVGCDGGIFAFGDAAFRGGMGGIRLNCAVVGMDNNPRVDPVLGQGYWLVGCDGGVFNFGNASLWGSMGGQPLNAPISAIAATSTGNGYWLVGRDGGVFAFGDAAFVGSAAGVASSPIIAIAGNGTSGYWLLGEDGGIYAFGSASYRGNVQ